MLISDARRPVIAGDATLAVTTPQALTAVDTLGFDCVSFIVPGGDTVDATIAVQVSEDNSTWRTVSDHSLPMIADTVHVVDCIRLDRRYVRVLITPASATDFGTCIALLGDSTDAHLPLTPAAQRLVVAHKPTAA